MRPEVLTGGRAQGAPPIPFDRGHWRSRAACDGLDTELFFPERGESMAEAKAICQACPVRAPCDEWGLWEQFGVWAGQSERQRRHRRREPRRIPLSAAS